MTKMAEVINASIPEADRNIVSLHTNLILNTAGGRPSDAARQAIAQYKALGRDEFIHAHHQANGAALRDCGCKTCLEDYAKIQPATSPCLCWNGPCIIHSGHCCFRDTEECHPIPDDVRERLAKA